MDDATKKLVGEHNALITETVEALDCEGIGDGDDGLKAQLTAMHAKVSAALTSLAAEREAMGERVAKLEAVVEECIGTLKGVRDPFDEGEIARQIKDARSALAAASGGEASGT